MNQNKNNTIQNSGQKSDQNKNNAIQKLAQNSKQNKNNAIQKLAQNPKQNKKLDIHLTTQNKNNAIQKSDQNSGLSEKKLAMDKFTRNMINYWYKAHSPSIKIKPLRKETINDVISDYKRLQSKELPSLNNYYYEYFSARNDLLDSWYKEIKFYIFDYKLIKKFEGLNNKPDILNFIIQYVIGEDKFVDYVKKYDEYKDSIAENAITIEFLDSYAVAILNVLRLYGIYVPERFTEEDANYRSEGFKYIRCANLSICKLTGDYNNNVDIRNIVSDPGWMTTLFSEWIDYYINNVFSTQKCSKYMKIIEASTYLLPSFLYKTNLYGCIQLTKNSKLYELVEQCRNYPTFIESRMRYAASLTANSAASLTANSAAPLTVNQIGQIKSDELEDTNPKAMPIIEYDRKYYRTNMLASFISVEKPLGPSNVNVQLEEEKGLNNKLNDLIDKYSNISLKEFEEFKDIYEYINEI